MNIPVARIFFILVGICILHVTSGQVTKTIYGKVISSLNGNVQSAIVSNKQSNISTPVNKEGVFVIKAKAGDTLRFHSGSFHPHMWVTPSGSEAMLFPEIRLTPKERVWKKEEPVKVEIISGPLQVMGRVVDDRMQAMKGVTVVVKGQLKGTVSDDKGSFRIKSYIGDTLQFRNVGFKMRQFKVSQDAERVYREVIMIMDTAMLQEITVMPWLTKEMMSYENVALDASEINRMYLREKALYTDKTQFRTVSFNAAPLLGKWIGKGVQRFKQSKKQKVDNRVDVMRRKMFEDMQLKALREDSLFIQKADSSIIE